MLSTATAAMPHVSLVIQTPRVVVLGQQFQIEFCWVDTKSSFMIKHLVFGCLLPRLWICWMYLSDSTGRDREFDLSHSWPVSITRRTSNSQLLEQFDSYCWTKTGLTDKIYSCLKVAIDGTVWLACFSIFYPESSEGYRFAKTGPK